MGIVVFWPNGRGRGWRFGWWGARQYLDSVLEGYLYLPRFAVCMIGIVIQ